MAMWILVSDEASARLFEAEEAGQDWRPVTVFNHPQSRMKAKDLMTDFPNNMESGMPVRDHEGKVFARELAKYLQTHQNDFQRLILVGPPRFLGALRGELASPVAKKVTDSLNKELTQLNDRELKQKLADELMI